MEFLHLPGVKRTPDNVCLGFSCIFLGLCFEMRCTNWILMDTRRSKILGHVREESGIIIDRRSQNTRLTIIGWSAVSQPRP